ncbi:thermonuclease family protein [Mesorhizobium sp.]|uniref:thermonuclease family protein n=1 Tax=Mesorhizobium sp. TaxID=1871066 RepID=UPI00257B7E57|nr:thermonuclease family protein [Mesorhizobium sp.]
MGKGHRYQGANQADRWRRRAGRRMPSRRLPRPLLGLILLGAGTLAAAVTQFAIQSTAGQQSTAALQSTITNWTEPLPGPMQGRASVIDGDTVEIAGQRVRFNGIDAPESRQHCDDAKGFDYPCGRRAAQALDKFLAASRPLRCSFVDRDQYGRLVGNCNRADGRSIQKWLVEQGLALDWPRYSNGAFAAEQVSAKAAHRGVWQGRFDQPWDWRDANADKVESVSEQSIGFGLLGGCSIKGNISAKGERIYHVPEQKYYSQTRISQVSGERWFCSEAEAQAAGWRKARR